MKRNLYLAFVLASSAMLVSCTTRTIDPSRETKQAASSPNAININTASAEELEKIPHIGPKLASEIISFRERHGRFQQPEYLMLIRGFSDTRYREIKDFIKTE